MAPEASTRRGPIKHKKFRGLYSEIPVYDTGSPYFTIEYHYDGKLQFSPLVYDGGSIKYKDWCHKEFMTFTGIDHDVLDLGYEDGYVDYYWLVDMDKPNEAKRLNDNKDIEEMGKAAVENYGYVHIYLLERSKEEVRADIDNIIAEKNHVKSYVVIQEIVEDEPRDDTADKGVVQEESSSDSWLIYMPEMVHQHDSNVAQSLPEVDMEDVGLHDEEEVVEGLGLHDEVVHGDVGLDDEAIQGGLGLHDEAIQGDVGLQDEVAEGDDPAVMVEDKESSSDGDEFHDSDVDLADDPAEVVEDEIHADHQQQPEHVEEATTPRRPTPRSSSQQEVDNDTVQGGSSGGRKTGRGRGRTSSRGAGASSRGRRSRTADDTTSNTFMETDQDEEVEEPEDPEHSDGFKSIHSSDEEADSVRWPKFYAETDMKDPKFQEGMLFGSANDLRKAIKQYAIVNKVNVKFVKNTKVRVNAKCLNCCGWFLNASVNRKAGSMQVKKFKDQHTCGKEIPYRFITYKWIGESYIENVRADPNWSKQSLAHQLSVDYKARTNDCKLWRAKRHALEVLRKSDEKQYEKLWDYAEELRGANPGSSVFIQCDNLIFQRMYVCLDASKRGFLAGCRPIIGLDGCWLKGKYGGQILAAVGMDANDCIFPIAYAVVEIESKDSWSWFIGNLANDLNIGSSGGSWTFMADREKGLVNALETLMPEAEKRFCVRHLWKNLCRFDSISMGKEMKDLIWEAAKSTYPAQFKRCMDRIKVKSIKVWEWLSEKPPQQWSKSHFRDFSKSDILLNNLSECFNRYILDARDKPILTMAEMIRLKLMRRMCLKRNVAQKYNTVICPKILKKLEKAKDTSAHCWPQEASAQKFNVSITNKFYVVDLGANTCSCRRWQLTGIPCNHAISCILSEKRDPRAYIDTCYSVESLRASYAPVINPLRDMEDFKESEMEPIKPPPLKVKKGRPQKVRRKTIDETIPIVTSDGVRKITLKGSMVMTCRKCGKHGHNKRTCDRRSSQAEPSGAECRTEPRPTASASQDVPLSTPGTQMPASTPNEARTSDFISSRTVEMNQPNLSGPEPVPTSAFLRRWLDQEAQQGGPSGSSERYNRRPGTATDVAEFLTQQRPKTRRRTADGGRSVPSTQPPPAGI